jgi:hypothetical protein
VRRRQHVRPGSSHRHRQPRDGHRQRAHRGKL